MKNILFELCRVAKQADWNCAGSTVQTCVGLFLQILPDVLYVRELDVGGVDFFLQILPDVLYVRELDVRAADVAEDAELAAALQVLPLEPVSARCHSQSHSVHYRRMVLCTHCVCDRWIHLQIRRVQRVS